MKTRLRTHMFADSGQRDGRGQPICTCGSAKSAAVHRIPEQDPAVTEHEARRVGER